MWQVLGISHIWLFNDIIILVRCSKLIPTCLSPAFTHQHQSILLLTQPLVLSGVERPGVSTLLRLSQLIRPKLTTILHDTSTAKYCWTHPHTVATEEAARLLATVSSWKQLNLRQLPRSSLTNKEKGLGLAFTRGWSESGPRHIYGLLAEPWMRHLTKDTSQNSAILHPAWYNLTGSASPCPTLLGHWAQDKTKLSEALARAQKNAKW